MSQFVTFATIHKSDVRYTTLIKVKLIFLFPPLKRVIRTLSFVSYKFKVRTLAKEL